MSAEDIAKELNCSKSHAYKIVKELNKEYPNQQRRVADLLDNEKGNSPNSGNC